MNTFLSTLVLLTALMQSSDSVTGKPITQQVSASRSVLAVPQQTLGVQAASGVELGDVVSLLGEQPSWEQARATVLVIPTPDLPAESVEELTEDMAVMTRILDKALLPTRVRISAGAGTGQILSLVLGQPTSASQGLYLDGYGVLFFLQVDCPLVPTQPQEQESSPPQEQGDPVWSQTIEEMTGRPEGRNQTDRAGQTYDRQRVESLRRMLLKTLAHAANIRTPGSQDRITLVVGALDDGMAYYRTASVGTSTRLPGMGTLRGSRSGTRVRGEIQVTAAPAATGVMILHVAKSDVDAFAKGRLTLAQFTEKVQTLWSGPEGNVSADNTPAAAPAPAPDR